MVPSRTHSNKAKAHSVFSALGSGIRGLPENILHSWGRSWISVMLLHIFEALLSDPIYSGNSDEKGWKWLNYSPGNPRPFEGKAYLDYTLENGTNLNPNNA